MAFDLDENSQSVWDVGLQSVFSLTPFRDVAFRYAPNLDLVAPQLATVASGNTNGERSAAGPVAEEAAPSLATITARGDDRLNLYVNGELVLSTVSWTDVEVATLDLSSGDVIAAEMTNTGGIAGFIADIRLSDGTTLSTGGDWLVSDAIPGSDWRDQGFDDSAWVNATVIGPIGTPPWPNPSGAQPPIPTDGDANWIWDSTNGERETIYFRFTVPQGIGNVAPVADETVPDQTATEDSAFSFTLSPTLFSDGDGDTLTLAATLSDGSDLPDWLSFDGSSFSGTPENADTGDLDVLITASDGNGGTATAPLTIAVQNINDQPVAANDDAAAVPGFLVTLDVLANDIDEDGDDLTITEIDGNTVSIGGVDEVDLGDAVIRLNADGTLSFTADPGFFGQVNFAYTVSDGAETSTANVSVGVTDGSVDLSGSDVAVVIDLDTLTLTEAAKILTFGDSLTAGFGTEYAYRLPLWQSIVEDSGLWLDFVGFFSSTEGATDAGGTLVDVEHNGIFGGPIDLFVSPNVNTAGFIDLFDPSVTFIVLGTNDVIQDPNAGTGVPLELEALVREAAATNPGRPIFLAEIPPLDSAKLASIAGVVNLDAETLVNQINAELPAIVAQLQSEGINVFLVPTSQFVDKGMLLGDGIHLTTAGNIALGQAFQFALDSFATEAGGTYFNTPDSILPTTDVTGSDNGDRIFGSRVADNINGGLGNDWLEGRGGIDSLTGGAGRDAFALLSPGDEGDTITDFQTGLDRIVVDASLLSGLSDVADLTFDADNATGDGPTLLYNTTTGELSYDADGNDSGTAVELFTLDGAPALVFADITVLGLNPSPTADVALGDTQATEFSAFSYTLPANAFSDPEGEPLVITATGPGGTALPGWLDFDALTGTLSGTPGGNDAGFIDVEFTATDPSGNTASDLLGITILDAPPPPATQEATITARGDDRINLFVNGELVLSTLSWRDVEEATVELGAGDVIAVEMTNTGGLGGFIADVRLADGTLLSTSDDWLVNDSVSGTEWREPGFDDSTWDSASVIGPIGIGPWGNPSGSEPALPEEGEANWIWDTTNGQQETIYFRYTVPGDVGNLPPVADESVADQAADEDSAFLLELSPTLFSDGDGDQLFLSAAQANGQPLSDWLTFDGTSFSGTPENSDVGEITVRVSASDGRGGTSSTDFTLTINNTNDQPITVDDSASTDVNTAVNVAVLTNDTDDDVGDTLSLLEIAGQGIAIGESLTITDGTVRREADGSITVTPDTGFVGLISFDYTVTDGTESDTGSVTVSVALPNQAPIATDLDGGAVSEDDQSIDLSITDALALGSLATDVDDTITADDISFGAVTVVSANTEVAGTYSFAEVGALLTSAGETLSFDPSDVFNALATDESAEVQFSFTASDGELTSNTAALTFVVNGSNDAPEVAALADQSVVENNALTVVLPPESFSDPDDSNLILSATLNDGSDLPNWLTFTAATGSFSGTPGAGDVGNITVRVTATDDEGASGFADFGLSVAPEAPPAQQATITARGDDRYNLYVNGELLISGTGWLDVEVATVELAPGDVIAVEGIDTGGLAAFIAAVVLEDGTTLSSSADWLIETNVTGTDWQEQGFDDSAWLNATEYGPVATAPWLGTAAGQPIVPDDADAQWIWTDDNGGDNNVFMRFVVPGGNGGGTDPTNTAPTAVDDTASTEQGIAKNIDVVDNDTDTENDALSVIEVEGQAISIGGSVSTSNGMVTMESDGTLTFVPDASFNGVETFAYTLSDGDLSDTGSVTVSVSPTSGPASVSFAGTDTAKVINLEEGVEANAARILTLGDSITQGFNLAGAYRLPLFNSIVDEQGLWVDMVGIFDSNNPTDTRDGDHRGVSGITADTVKNSANTIAEDTPYDIALVLLGTNDVRVNSNAVTETPDDILTILRGMNTDEPGKLILLGKLPEFSTGAFGITADTQARRDGLNAALPGVVATAQSEGINVVLVDTDQVLESQMSDGLHPNAAGAATMADIWLAALLDNADLTGGTFNGTENALAASVIDVTGSDAGDRIEGDARANVLNGGAGNDAIYGGGGLDTLIGGSGDDTFILRAADTGTGNTATVSDFSNGDYVQLEAFGFASLGAAEAAFTQQGADVVFSANGVTAVFENANVATVRDGIRIVDSSSALSAGADVQELVSLDSSESFDFSTLPTRWDGNDTDDQPPIMDDVSLSRVSSPIEWGNAHDTLDPLAPFLMQDDLDLFLG